MKTGGLCVTCKIMRRIMMAIVMTMKIASWVMIPMVMMEIVMAIVSRC